MGIGAEGDAACARAFQGISGLRNPDPHLSSLSREFGVEPGEIRFTPRRRIPIVVRGADETSFRRAHARGAPVHELREYDAVVVGGGLSGLTAGIYLTDRSKRVLLLERDGELGGLAAGGERAGVRYARGAAYFSPPDRNTYRIFQHIGLGDYKRRFTIHEPIDSYLHDREFYRDVWEEPSLSRLPRSFKLFKHALLRLDERIPSQPIEDSGLLQWDHLTAADWIRALPDLVASWKDSHSRRIYREFLDDTRIDRNDPMGEVIDFVNLYSRSALGFETDKVSATAFANFYSSEIDVRYTGEYGSGDIAVRMAEILRERETANLSLNSTVTRLRNTADGVEVEFTRDGVPHVVRARKVIFAAPLGLAPRLIEGFGQQAPEHARILEGLEYAHYSVHNVFVRGHPWRESYDLWIRHRDYTDADPTDIILGRWQDGAIRGYDGIRDFSADPPDSRGVISIYHPLPRSAVGSGYTDALAIRDAEMGVERAEAILGPLLRERWGTDLDIRFIETNRWPYSIHVVKPGWLTQARTLRQPVGNIHFGNNNLGLPSVEEALFRGHRAALDVLESLDGAQQAAPARGQNR